MPLCNSYTKLQEKKYISSFTYTYRNTTCIVSKFKLVNNNFDYRQIKTAIEIHPNTTLFKIDNHFARLENNFVRYSKQMRIKKWE